MTDALHADVPGGQVLADVSNAMVALYKEQFGRGPTKTRTSFAGPDVLITSLEDTLTPAERSLAGMGEHQRLRDVRMFFQYASEDQFRELVERHTGRRVRAFISGIDTERDIAAEVFYLEPLSGDGGGAGATQSAGELGENGQVGVKLDALKTTHAER